MSQKRSFVKQAKGLLKSLFSEVAAAFTTYIFVRFRWRWHLDPVCFLQLVRASLQGDPKPVQGVFQRLSVATTFSPLAGLKACLPGYGQSSNLREEP